VSRADSILAEALALPEEERAGLALRLAESLQPALPPDAGDAWVDEIARRVARLRDGSAKTVSGAEALAAAQSALTARRA
jgi:hypothetical protein